MVSFRTGDKVHIAKIYEVPKGLPRHLHPSFYRKEARNQLGIVWRFREDNKLVEVVSCCRNWQYTFMGEELELIDRPSIDELLTHDVEYFREYYAKILQNA